MAAAVAAITDQLGYDPEAAPDADEEVTRQSDLGRMRSLAAEFERAHPDGDAAAFGPSSHAGSPPSTAAAA